MSDRFLEVRVDTKEVEQALEQMQRRSLNLRPFMGAVGQIIIKSAHENFEQQGRPKWKGWAPLTQQIHQQGALDDAMRTHKTKAGQNRQTIRNLGKLGLRKILQNTGELKKSVVIGRLDSEAVEVGSSLIYSRIHQLGGDIVPKRKRALYFSIGGGKFIKLMHVKIPARPFLKLQESDYQVIVRVAHDYLIRGEIG